MISNEILIEGVAQGIITAEQAERLRGLKVVGEPPELPASPDDEQLRFISGFSDIFVTIGLAMFLGAIKYFASKFFSEIGMWIAIAITAWLLAEFFTRLRRMALPSIVLLIVLAVAVFLGASHIFGAGYGRSMPYMPSNLTGSLLGIDPGHPMAMAAAAFLSALLTAVHYARFRVPITIAAGCAALTGMVVALLYALAPDLPPVVHNAVILACGLAVFALAMRFDMADPERLTRRTDIAFWLHLLAAPLIVHSLIRGLVANTKLEPTAAIAVMVVFLALSFIAVLIDRRAMLVSGLSYAGTAFWTLFREAGFSDMTTPLTILALGAFVLLLSAGWRPLRAGILNNIPSALARNLPKTSS